MIVSISREQVPACWRDIESLVESALKHARGEYDKLDILSCLCSGDMHLFMVLSPPESSIAAPKIRGIAITQFVNYPRYRACQVVVLAGENMLRGWLRETTQHLSTAAKHAGCKRLQAVGRLGWKRALKKIGAECAYTIMVKEL